MEVFNNITQRSDQALLEEEEQRRKFEAARKQSEEEARKRAEDRQRREREEREAERERMRDRARALRNLERQDSGRESIPVARSSCGIVPAPVFYSLRHVRFSSGTLTFLNLCIVHAIVKCVIILRT